MNPELRPGCGVRKAGSPEIAESISIAMPFDQLKRREFIAALLGGAAATSSLLGAAAIPSQ
jgi:hypothetical protein